LRREAPSFWKPPLLTSDLFELGAALLACDFGAAAEKDEVL